LRCTKFGGDVIARKVIILNEISPKLAVLDERVEAAVAIIFDHFGLIAENEMKTGARWTDRTGNARAGLVSEASRDGNDFHLNFASMASYGIWLEIRWSGKYAIVGPVMENIAPRLAQMIADTALP
jgi:hypothetical protein